MLSQYNIGKLRTYRGSCADYNSNNTWNYNGNNGCMNNNNRYNRNFLSRPVLEYDWYNNANLDSYAVTLDEWLGYAIESSKRKRKKRCYVEFFLHLSRNLIHLAHEVGNMEVMPTESTAHIIQEPKVREIVCSSVSKRIIHTYFMREIEPYLEKHLYHKDSYSCRKGRGVLNAVKSLQDYIFEETNGYTEDIWIAKIDIKSFFMSIDCFIIYRLLCNFIKKHMIDTPKRDLLLYLTRITYLGDTKSHIIDKSHPYERLFLENGKSLRDREWCTGIPIGDWTSQIAGLIVTSYALNYIESLGYKFVHYTDDTVILVKDKKKWKEDIERIECFYKHALKLLLHPYKRYFQHYSKGVEFLGYKIRFNRILPSDRIYDSIQWKIKYFLDKNMKNHYFLFKHRNKIISVLNSYLGLLQHMSSYYLRENICQRIAVSPLSKFMLHTEKYEKMDLSKKYFERNIYKKEYKDIKHTDKCQRQI